MTEQMRWFPSLHFQAMRTGFRDFQMLSLKRQIPKSSQRTQIGSVESGHLSFSTISPNISFSIYFTVSAGCQESLACGHNAGYWCRCAMERWDSTPTSVMKKKKTKKKPLSRLQDGMSKAEKDQTTLSCSGSLGVLRVSTWRVCKTKCECYSSFA